MTCRMVFQVSLFIVILNFLIQLSQALLALKQKIVEAKDKGEAVWITIRETK